jgi:hypothetical protein
MMAAQGGAPRQEASQQEPALALLFGGPARWSSDVAMHRQFVERFGSAVGLGRARMVSPSLRVHDDMRLTLTVPDDEGSPPATLRYQLKTLELIGIARHANPVAFVIGTHTDRSGAEHTRPLNAFERRALVRLRSGNEVAAETTKAGRHVVGAIRATGECTSCHGTSKVGENLGAFSYRLALVTTATSAQ